MKLNDVQLDRVPDELSRLKSLEHLQMTKNSLTSVHGEVSDLPALRSVIVRRNQVVFFHDSLSVVNVNANGSMRIDSRVESTTIDV